MGILPVYQHPQQQLIYNNNFMSYVAIPSNLKHINSIWLELMSPEEMLKMSYGEVLTSETINYRTGTPQMNGLFCQAIFGPVKNWECACGKYKRYRYAGVICDKCGVEVTHSSVRRERMGHISLAAPCAHPWFFRIVPSRIALMLDMKTLDVSRVVYFSAYIITDVNEELRTEYLSRIDNEARVRISQVESEYDKKFDEIGKQFQKDKSEDEEAMDKLVAQFEAGKELLKKQKSEQIARVEAIADLAKKEISALELKQVITELQYQELAQKFGPIFKAQIGAEALETLLKRIDLKQELLDMDERALKVKGETKRKLVKRLKLVKHFVNNSTKPEWMILHRIMVLPPELRPMLQLDGGRFATSDLNELYRRLINRNNRLRKLIQIGAPEVILRNEKRMLQEAVEALIDNSVRGGKQVMASTGIKRPLKSLTDVLKGKQGRFRQNLLGKRVDYSGRSVVVVGPQMALDECGIPKEMAVELFTPFLIGGIIRKSEEGVLSENEQAFNVHSARRLIENKHPVIYDILEEVIKDKYVLLNRAPTLHKLSFMAFRPILIEGRAIQLNPLVCKAFNADFDGDQMAVHLPITTRGQQEAKDLMVSTKNLLKPATGELIMQGSQDMILGCYYLTKLAVVKEEKDMRKFASLGEVLSGYDLGLIAINEAVVTRLKNKETGEKARIVTSAGRILFNKAFPKEAPFYNEEVNKKAYEKLLNDAYHVLGSEKMPLILDNLKTIGFRYATQSGVTLSTFDLQIPAGKQAILDGANAKSAEITELYNIGLLNDNDKYSQVVDIWTTAVDKIGEIVKDGLDPLSNVGMMIQSGSRGSVAQLNQMSGIKGVISTSTGKAMELPVQHGYVEGLTALEYFISTKGARKGQADIALRTADSGYLTRRLVDVAQTLIITTDDAGGNSGKWLSRDKSKTLGKTVWERAFGRYILKDVEFEGKVVVKAGTLLDFFKFNDVKHIDVDGAWVYSITKCTLPRGLDIKSYGEDFSTHYPVAIGTPVGVVAAQSLGEPSTQLTLQSKHSGGVLRKADITSGLPRVEEIFEARLPKVPAPMADFEGTVVKIEGNIELGYTMTVRRDGQTLALPYDSKIQTLLVDEGKAVSSEEVIMIDQYGEATLANQTGVITLANNQVIVTADKAEIKEYMIDPGTQPLIKIGEKVIRAQQLSEGHLNLQEVLDKAGIDALEDYIISELNAIYSSNGISVNEKHIEVIVRQMCNKVTILEPGDSPYTASDMVSLPMVLVTNKQLRDEGKKIAVFKRSISGISKASLSTDSFLSAASFQETARVLVEAVLSSRKDNLTGLKENVILGQLIPAGTGYSELKATEEVQEEYEVAVAL
jgi:DNA-directed RNA polymerase subunit beta'